MHEIIPMLHEPYNLTHEVFNFFSDYIRKYNFTRFLRLQTVKALWGTVICFCRNIFSLLHSKSFKNK